jgi:hypothetical protein
MRPVNCAVGFVLIGFLCVSCNRDDEDALSTRPPLDSPKPAVVSAPPENRTEPGSSVSAQAPSRVWNPIPLDSFPQLPPDVRNVLAEQNCVVPQTFYPKTPHSVISGEFAANGQVDWAALCSRNDSSRIVVVWGGANKCSSVLNVSPESRWFQGIGSGVIGYSRYIATASMESILRLAREFDGPAPPARDHDGIHDGFMEKASRIYFCHAGKWYTLQGVD